MKLVIEGQRSLALSAAADCAKKLGLVDRQVRFFVKLVEIDQETNDSLKSIHIRELQALLPHAKKKQLGLEDTEYLSHWLFPVIHELVALKDFTPDALWIERRLRVKVQRSEIDRCLRTLLESGYLFKGETGRYETKDSVIVSTDELHSFAVRQFHRMILSQSTDVLEIVPVEEREYAALTMMLPSHKLIELKERLKNFRNEIHDWAATCCLSDLGDTVIQCNFQVYPQNRKLEKLESKK